MTVQWLIADIGATHARLALVDPQAPAQLQVRQRWQLADFAQAAALFDAYLASCKAELGTVRLAGAALALAGPVQTTSTGQQVQLVNAPQLFSAAALSQQLGAAVHLLHDFAAQAHGLAAMPAAHRQQLLQLGGTTPASGPCALLGPGTGLGMGLLVPQDHDYLVLSSEGGHAGLAPADLLETEILRLLLLQHPHVSWETVLCGSGLVRLYQAVCNLWDCAPDWDRPEDISSQALALDPVCHQTLELFCSLLGSAAGSQALIMGATGGLYLCGGLLPAIKPLLLESQFRQRFDAHGDLSAYCRQIPVFLVEDPWLGLRGAAQFAARLAVGRCPQS